MYLNRTEITLLTVSCSHSLAVGNIAFEQKSQCTCSRVVIVMLISKLHTAQGFVPEYMHAHANKQQDCKKHF